MVKFNTLERFFNRSSLSSLEQVFKAFSQVPNALKTGLAATLLLCCLSTQKLAAQCCPISQPSGASIDLSLNSDGTVELNPTVFVPYVGSSIPSCLPANGGVIQLWQDIAATLPFPNTVYNCSQVGTMVNVYVTLDVPGACPNPPVAAFVVTIVDNVLPIIFPPGNISVNVDPNTCASVQSLTATVLDNCPGNLALTHTLTHSTMGFLGTFPGFTANHAYNKGTTTITWTADDGPNSVTATTTVTVTDNQLPTLSCPSNISVNNDPGNCSAVVGYSAPVASDNCPGSSVLLTAGLPSGSAFPVGITTVAYKVTDASGNMATCSFTVTVVDNQLPVFTGPFHPSLPPDGGNTTVSPSPACIVNIDFLDIGGVSDNCPGATISHSINGGSSIPEGDANGPYGVGTYIIVYTITDLAGNSDTYTVTVIVEDLNPPVANCMGITVQLNSAGLVTVVGTDINNGSTDNCGVVDYNIAKDEAPTDNMPDGGFFLNSISFSCSDILTSPHTVLLQVLDANGNADTCFALITVEDNEPPVAQCQDITVNLVTGMTPSVDVYAEGTSPFVDNGSFDNCTSQVDLDFMIRKVPGSFQPSGMPVTFGCAEVGANTVEIKVTDQEGNSNFCQATVTVKDVTPPTAVCQNIIVNLDANGEATILASQVNNGSSDDCSISLSVAPNSFDCDDLTFLIGLTTVTLTVTDPGGNTATCTATVDIQDIIVPTAVCKPDTAYLDAFGNATVLATDINGGSTDNCDLTYLIRRLPNPPFSPVFQSSVNFSCLSLFPPNPDPVELQVTDQDGNTATCTTTVLVVDPINPVAICVPVTVALGTNGMVTVPASSIGALSSDNCSPSFALSILMSVDTNNDNIADSPYNPDFTFDCGDLDDAGGVTVKIQVTDGSNNSAVCQTTVTVQDNEVPTLTCPPDMTIEWVTGLTLDPDDIGSEVVIDPAVPGPNDGLADDNCEVTVTWQDLDTIFGDCDVDGYVFKIIRVWTAIDSVGNFDTCHQVITLIDTQAPTFTAPADVMLECPESYTVANHICTTLVSTNVPRFISDVGIDTDTSTILINVPVNGKVTDVNLSLKVSHTWVEHLDVQLEYYPPGFIAPTVVVPILNDICSSSDNVDLTFDDSGLTYNIVPQDQIPCPPTDQSNTYHPTGNLSDFNSQFINGTWLLRIFDDSNLDGGALTAWSLNICYVPQEANLTYSGDVTDEADDCDTNPQATFKDYEAFKDFTITQKNNPPLFTTYNFSVGSPGVYGSAGVYGVWTYAETELGAPSSTDAVVNLTNAPTSISITGANDEICFGPFTDARADFTTTIPANGWVAFDWSYVSSNTHAGFDPFGYLLDPFGAPPLAFVQLTDGAYGTFSGATIQSGRVLLKVSSGDIFGFSQRSYDSSCGAATTTITNFVFIDELICPVPAFDCPREFCIARIWDLVDDCGNEAASQIQIIRTKDTTPPDIDFQDTVTVLAQGGICTPFVDLDLSGDISDSPCSSYEDLVITNNAQANYGTGNGTDDASGFYAPGTYTITFTAEDECGNLQTHVITLIVIDAQDPFAVCHPFITVQLDNMGNASLAPANVNNGSSDNCGIVNMTLSQTNFTTADIGQVPVTLTVYDAQGNSNTCTSIITVLGGVIFDAGDACANTGDMVMVPVTVEDFDDIAAFSMKLNITDGTVANILANPNGIANINPLLTAPGNIFSFNATSSTSVTVSWVSGSPTGLDLPDGTTLFFVKANLTGALGSSTPIVIADDDVVKIVGGVPTNTPSVGLGGTICVININNTFTVSGTLQREPLCGSDDVDNVTVNLTGSSSVPPSPILDADGFYSFSVPQGSSPTVTPFKDGTTGLGGTWFNGVNILDVIEVNQHFLALDLLDSPYEIIAADANKSGSITIADVFIINQLALQTLPMGLGNTAWRFVDASFVFPNPANPFLTPFPESITFPNVNSNQAGNFIGIKVGDVDCSANPALFTGGSNEDRSNKLPFVADDYAVVAGQDVVMTFKAKDFTDMLGYQMTVNFNTDALQFVEFVPGNVENLSVGNFNPTEAAQGLLATNWFTTNSLELENGQEVFTLKFKALKDGTLSGLIHISSDFIEAMAYKASGEVLGVNLEFEGSTATGEQESSIFALYQNRPNPFGFKTSIGFKLPESTYAKLTIHDPSGRVLKVVEGDFTAGYHQVVVDRSELPANGVLFYRLETATNMAVRKMVLLD